MEINISETTKKTKQISDLVNKRDRKLAMSCCIAMAKELDKSILTSLTNEINSVK